MRRYWLLLPLLLLACTETHHQTQVVGIQPYEGCSLKEAQMVAKTVGDFYHVSTVVLPKKDLPKSAYTTIKSPRYRADSLIQYQNRTITDTIDCLLGLTGRDISMTKKDINGAIKKPVWKYNDFGVMGLAYCPGKSAIVSTYRLHHKEVQKRQARLQKVAIHELGHTLGLPHCPDRHCVMTSAAEKISTIDTEKMALCTVCKKQLE